MAAPRNVRKNINLFVDGFGQAGQIEDYNAPKITLQTEEFRGGGMGGPLKITMGHEALDTDFSLISYDAQVLRLMNIREGFDTQLTARQALESNDGSVVAVVHNMRGKITELDAGTSKAGDKGTLKVSMALSYYKETHNGVVVHEIDVENMKWIRNGVDAYELIRNALGMN